MFLNEDMEIDVQLVQIGTNVVHEVTQYSALSLKVENEDHPFLPMKTELRHLQILPLEERGYKVVVAEVYKPVFW